MKITPNPSSLPLLVLAGVLFLFGAFVGNPFVIWVSMALSLLIGTFYLSLLFVSLELRAKKVGISWQTVFPLEKQSSQGGWITLSINNQSSKTLTISGLSIHGSKHIKETLPSSDVESSQCLPHASLSSKISLHPIPAGYHVIHGFNVVFEDKLGLFSTKAYFAKSTGFWSSINAERSHKNPLSSKPKILGTSFNQKGFTARAHEGRLRQIRAYQSGDSFRNIAWKKTASRHALMVRENEEHLCKSILFVWNNSAQTENSLQASQRQRAASSGLLHQASATLRNGHRVGLFVQCKNKVMTLPTSGHPSQNKKIVTMIHDSLEPCTYSSLDIFETHLFDTIANHIKQQSSIDLSVAPSMAKSSLLQLLPGAQGQFYVRSTLEKIIDDEYERLTNGVSFPYPKHWTPTKSTWATSDIKFKCVFYAHLTGLPLLHHTPSSPDDNFPWIKKVSTAAKVHKASDLVLLVEPLHFLQDESAAKIRKSLPRIEVTIAFPTFAPNKRVSHAISKSLFQNERRALSLAQSKASKLRLRTITMNS